MKTFKKLAALILAAACTFSLVGCGSASNDAVGDIKKAGKLTMVCNAEFAPFESKEGDKVVGIDADIAKAIADDLGVELEIQDIDFDACIPSVKRLQADIKEAIIKKEFSRDHFDIRVRDEMELLMKSANEFDRFQAKKIIEREKARDKAVRIDDRLAEIIVSEEEDELERLSRESAEKAEKLRKDNRLNREWLMDEMSRDMASLRLLLGITADDMGNLLGVSGNTYKNLESGKKEISWDQYMALLFVFRYNDRTSPVTDTLGLFPEPLKVRMKKGTNSIYG